MEQQGRGGEDAPGRIQDEAETRRALVSLLPRLQRFALSLTGTRQDAEDLLHTSLERALSRLHQWQPGTRLDSWMYRIIQNVRIDQSRQERTRPVQVALDTERESALHAAHGDSEAALTLDAVLAAMQQLSPEHRTILSLVCIEGLRYREAAEVLDISPGTVMSRLARARQRLHEQLQAGRRQAGRKQR